MSKPNTSLTLAVMVVVVIGLSAGCDLPKAAPTTAPSAEVAKQPERERLMGNFQSAGLWDRIDDRSDYPTVWVTKKFNAQRYDDKFAAIGVVYAYYKTANPSITMVVMKDNVTGKRVGYFNDDGMSLD